MGPDRKEIDNTIKDIQHSSLKITVDGTVTDFLGVNISKLRDESLHLHQPHLIDEIIKEVNFTNETTIRDTPSPAKILFRHSQSKDFDNSFHFRRILEKKA